MQGYLVLSTNARNDFKSIFIIKGGPGEPMTPPSVSLFQANNPQQVGKPIL